MWRRRTCGSGQADASLIGMPRCQAVRRRMSVVGAAERIGSSVRTEYLWSAHLKHTLHTEYQIRREGSERA